MKDLLKNASTLSMGKRHEGTGMGGVYGFATDLETGNSVYISPGIIKRFHISDDDEGRIFYGHHMQVSGQGNSNRLTAFLQWEDGDPETKESPALTGYSLEALRDLETRVHTLMENVRETEDAVDDAVAYIKIVKAVATEIGIRVGEAIKTLKGAS